MRKLIILLSFLLSYDCFAYNFSKVDNAIQEMKLGHIEQSVYLLKKNAAVNDILAQFYLGECYEYGIGMNVDLQSAFKMYRRAAERGFPPAMKELARCYKQGIGVMPNISRSDEWLSRYHEKKGNLTVLSLLEIYATVDNHNEITEREQEFKETDKLSEIKVHRTVSDKSNHTVIPRQEASVTYTPVIKQQQEEFVSDVDIDIPQTHEEKSDVFAFIIANEDYQDVAHVPNALNDGEIMAKYCQFTLGIPEENIHLIKNATLNNIRREINIMSKIAEAYKGQASFIVYYAGHGIPDEATRDAFLVPIDGYVADVTTCYKLSEFYSALGQMPSRKTIVMLDACFSGASRQGEMLASARGVVIKSKPAAPTGNMLVITSATGDETAYPYSEQKHGLFTYYLLKKLKDTQGKTTIGALIDYVSDNVAKKSIVINGKSQTPTAIPSKSLGINWKSWTLN